MLIVKGLQMASAYLMTLVIFFSSYLLSFWKLGYISSLSGYLNYVILSCELSYICELGYICDLNTDFNPVTLTECVCSCMDVYAFFFALHGCSPLTVATWCFSAYDPNFQFTHSLIKCFI
jgi:hypothetical protein